MGEQILEGVNGVLKWLCITPTHEHYDGYVVVVRPLEYDLISLLHSSSRNVEFPQSIGGQGVNTGLEEQQLRLMLEAEVQRFLHCLEVAYVTTL